MVVLGVHVLYHPVHSLGIVLVMFDDSVRLFDIPNLIWQLVKLKSKGIRMSSRDSTLDLELFVLADEGDSGTKSKSSEQWYGRTRKEYLLSQGEVRHA